MPPDSTQPHLWRKELDIERKPLPASWTLALDAQLLLAGDDPLGHQAALRILFLAALSAMLSAWVPTNRYKASRASWGIVGGLGGHLRGLLAPHLEVGEPRSQGLPRVGLRFCKRRLGLRDTEVIEMGPREVTAQQRDAGSPPMRCVRRSA